MYDRAVARAQSPATVLVPVAREKLAESVARQLLEWIRFNHLEAETRIPSERELMATLGVGRSTIREALNGLALLGVIEIRHGQGAFVARNPPALQTPDAIATALSKGVTRDLLEARSIIEVSIAELAARRRTPADLRELDAVLAGHAELLAADRSGAGRAATFHIELAEAAHNEVLAGFIASIADLLAERGPVLEQQPGYASWELAEHRLLFEAVRDGNPSLAAARMRSHLDAMSHHHAQLPQGQGSKTRSRGRVKRSAAGNR
jgi:GntR family transcriptional repressor for pyruvate dehydrogenase complex